MSTTNATTTPATNAAAQQLSAAEWATAAARILFYLQAYLPDAIVENRDIILETELQRLLETVPPEKRRGYLDVLAEKFPTWESIITNANTSSSAAPATGTTSTVAKSHALHTVPSTPSTSSTDLLTTDIAEKLKFTQTDAIDSTRLGKLLAALTEFAITSDQLVWNIWKSIAPKSALRRDNSVGDLRTALRRSITGDPEVPAAQLETQLERTRQLTASLIAAISPAGKTFARRHQTRYAPESIRDMVKLEGISVFGSPDSRYWKKYSELAQELSEDAIQTDLMEAIAKNAEDLLQNKNR